MAHWEMTLLNPLILEPRSCKRSIIFSYTLYIERKGLRLKLGGGIEGKRERSEKKERRRRKRLGRREGQEVERRRVKEGYIREESERRNY